METPIINQNRNARFAITAKSLGHPSKLYTPITVINLEKARAAIVNAMWDTGCPFSVMSKSLADALGIEFDKSMVMAGIVDSQNTPIGMAAVSLVAGGGILRTYTSIIDGHVGGDKYSFIIGLDIIALGNLSISSSCTHTMLSFIAPASGFIDHAADASSDLPTKYVKLSAGNEDIEIFNGRRALDLIAESLTPEERRQIDALISNEK